MVFSAIRLLTISILLTGVSTIGQAQGVKFFINGDAGNIDIIILDSTNVPTEKVTLKQGHTVNIAYGTEKANSIKITNRAGETFVFNAFADDDNHADITKDINANSWFCFTNHGMFMGNSESEAANKAN